MARHHTHGEALYKYRQLAPRFTSLLIGFPAAKPHSNDIDFRRIATAGRRFGMFNDLKLALQGCQKLIFGTPLQDFADKRTARGQHFGGKIDGGFQ